uniref:CRACD like n=1 Tax=Podarcis muralis TaxID=64176 RepID=A0A670I943_PODMU
MHEGIMGSRALSHESIFIPETAQEPTRPIRVFSQENVSDRIRALQLKLQQNWKLRASSPFGTSSKRVDDTGMSSEDDGLPRSPPETSLLQEISSSVESQLFPRQPSAKIISLQTSDCNLSPPADFDTPAEFSSCLDNSAAKHKLLVKPRNQRSSRTRRPASRNQSEFQNDLSCTPEEDKNERNEMLAELTCEGDSSNHKKPTKSSDLANSVYSQQLEMSKDLQHNLSHQNEKTRTLHTTSESHMLLCENKPEGYQNAQEISHTVLSLFLQKKEDTAALNLIANQEPQREREHSETLKISSCGLLNSTSLNILNQENKQTYGVQSKYGMLSDKNVSTKDDVIPTLGGREKNTFKDAKALLEDISNKGTINASPSLPSTISLISKNSPHVTDLPYSESNSISQTSCTVPSPQTDQPPPLNLEKVKPIQVLSVSDKENSHPAIPSMLILGGKESSDQSTARKFSVSSAWGRSRTSSLNMKDTLVYENLPAMQILQAKIKNSSRNEKVKEDTEVNSCQERKGCTSKWASSSELESETAGRSSDRVEASPQPQVMASKPVLSNFSTALPQQSSTAESSCEEKTPFQVKLRSTSLSLKYRNSSLQESKEAKRYSAEFNVEKEGLPLTSLKSEKAEAKKTSDVNTTSFLTESLKAKSKASEQGSTKPPLPRKPILQHYFIAGTSTNIEKQEKVTKYPELKNEGKDLEMKPSPPEVPADTARGTESQTVPAWITIAKQKQRVMEQELSKEEKLVAADKAEAEKQIQEKERMEVIQVIPACDLRLTFKQAIFLFSHTVQSSALIEREDIKPLKKVSHSSPDQPSWMELAKKKSQAWSDMPQRIK